MARRTACAAQHVHCERSLARRRLRAWQGAAARGAAARQLAVVAAGRSWQLHALLGCRKARAAMAAWRGAAEEARRRQAAAAAAHAALAPVRSGLASALVRWRKHAEWRDAIASRDGPVREQAPRGLCVVWVYLVWLYSLWLNTYCCEQALDELWSYLLLTTCYSPLTTH